MNVKRKENAGKLPLNNEQKKKKKEVIIAINSCIHFLRAFQNQQKFWRDRSHTVNYLN